MEELKDFDLELYSNSNGDGSVGPASAFTYTVSSTTIICSFLTNLTEESCDWC